MVSAEVIQPASPSAAAATVPPFDYLRVSVTERCQLNCAYCRPTGPPTATRDPLPAGQLLAYCGAICAVAPIRKVRLSGGEPLLRPDLPELIAGLSALPTHPEVTLTTNGVLLAERASELIAAGLSRVNVSLDHADAPSAGQVLHGLRVAAEAGFSDTKINAVLTVGLGVGEIAGLLSIAADHRAMLRFIELMPVGHEKDAYEANYLPAGEGLRRIAEAARGWVSSSPGQAGHPRYVATVADGREVTVEMIAPMSQPFCADCRRIRLSCDGELIPCLLSPTRLPLLDAEGRPPDSVALTALLRQCASLKCRSAVPPPQGMWGIGG